MAVLINSEIMEKVGINILKEYINGIHTQVRNK
jgi:hypothetical protein